MVLEKKNNSPDTLNLDNTKTKYEHSSDKTEMKPKQEIILALTNGFNKIRLTIDRVVLEVSIELRVITDNNES